MAQDPSPLPGAPSGAIDRYEFVTSPAESLRLPKEIHARLVNAGVKTIHVSILADGRLAGLAARGIDAGEIEAIAATSGLPLATVIDALTAEGAASEGEFASHVDALASRAGG